MASKELFQALDRAIAILPKQQEIKGEGIASNITLLQALTSKQLEDRLKIRHSEHKAKLDKSLD